MKPIPHRHHAAGKRKIRQRLDRPVTAASPRPVLTGSNIHYDVADKTRAISCGVIGAIPPLVRRLGLAQAIDERLHLLKFHLPHHESDHVLDFAYNALCNGTCLDDIDLRRNDVVFLDALGADRIPDPTTAGDFCRCFTAEDVETLRDVFDQTGLPVADRQKPTLSLLARPVSAQNQRIPRGSSASTKANPSSRNSRLPRGFGPLISGWITGQL